MPTFDDELHLRPGRSADVWRPFALIGFLAVSSFLPFVLLCQTASAAKLSLRAPITVKLSLPAGFAWAAPATVDAADDGTFIITGTADSRILNNSLRRIGWATKLDRHGNVIWSFHGDPKIYDIRSGPLPDLKGDGAADASDGKTVVCMRDWQTLDATLLDSKGHPILTHHFDFNPEMRGFKRALSVGITNCTSAFGGVMAVAAMTEHYRQSPFDKSNLVRAYRLVGITGSGLIIDRTYSVAELGPFSLLDPPGFAAGTADGGLAFAYRDLLSYTIGRLDSAGGKPTAVRHPFNPNEDAPIFIASRRLGAGIDVYTGPNLDEPRADVHIKNPTQNLSLVTVVHGSRPKLLSRFMAGQAFRLGDGRVASLGASALEEVGMVRSRFCSIAILQPDMSKVANVLTLPDDNWGVTNYPSKNAAVSTDSRSMMIALRSRTNKPLAFRAIVVNIP